METDMRSEIFLVKTMIAEFKNAVEKKYLWKKTQRLPSLKKGWGFPGGAVVENLPTNAGDTGSSPGLGRSHMPRSN